MSEFPTLAEVVNGHHWYRPSRHDKPWITRCVGCNWIGDTRNTGKSATGLHAEHVQEVWREACAITTVEQLDALPQFSIVGLRMEDGHLFAIEMDDGWCAVHSPFEVERDEIAAVIEAYGPAQLLHHPDWSKA